LQGALQLGAQGAQQVGSQHSAGAQQVGSQHSAGAQQVGSQHPPPQQLRRFFLNSFGILNFGNLKQLKQLFFFGRQQPSLQQAAGAQQLGAAVQQGAGAQQVGAALQQGAGAQQVGSQHSAGAQQVGSQHSAGAQQDGSEEQPPQWPLLHPNRPASTLLAMVNTIKAADRVIPFIVSLLLTR